ncbi:uncharacterized protein LOC135702444 [Ochlerotatus camptorhynchus]|uniref:uncharacterized protein LOC135702444 n=1 Tax=Ochlerotatus camptorhynchus TaxID=644619 RepID=UPI0031E1515C
MNPSSGNNQQNPNCNVPSTMQDVYYTPQQYYQQQFPHQRAQTYSASGHMNNSGLAPNMPTMLQSHQAQRPHQAQMLPTTPAFQPATLQQPGTGPLPGGIQYFMDAACTVPAGSLPQQPQALNQFPPHQQRLLMSQSSSSSLAKENCTNPHCTHCCKPQTAPAGANLRRR